MSRSCYAEGVNRLRFALAIGASALLAACADAPIAWEQPTPLGAPLGPTDRITVGADGVVRVVADSSPRAPVHPGQCPSSVRAARDTTGEWYATWWAVRADSTAEVVVARSADGVAWDAPVRVDTVDAGRSGCRRAAPAIDAWAGHVHVAYSMAAREGAGIFASHSMDRGVLFHTPVAVMYGERIGETSIAARGNLVAIAFEDPNSAQDDIALAFSNTMAHLFQHRETVSPPGGGARAPRIAVGDGRLAIAWMRASGGTPPGWLGRTGVIR